jgi:hypothetical protein
MKGFQILKDENKGLHHVFNSNITGKRKNRYTTQKTGFKCFHAIISVYI